MKKSLITQDKRRCVIIDGSCLLSYKANEETYYKRNERIIYIRIFEGSEICIGIYKDEDRAKQIIKQLSDWLIDSDTPGFIMPEY